MRQFRRWVLAIVLTLPVHPVNATLIFREFDEINGGIRGLATFIETVRIRLVESTRFSEFSFALDPVSKEISLELADGQPFIEAVDYLANNVSSKVNPVFLYNSGGGHGGVINDEIGIDPIDLAGRAIDQIRLSILIDEFISPGADLNGDGFWTNTRIVWSLEVFGSGDPTTITDLDEFLNRPDPPLLIIPEPDTLALLGIGLAGLCFARRAGSNFLCRN